MSKSPSTPAPVEAQQQVRFDDWDNLQLNERPKTWRDNQFVPIGMFTTAVCLAGYLVMRGRGDGRSLSQRVMEARVSAQAVLLAGIVGAGYLVSKTEKPREHASFSVDKQSVDKQ